MIDIQLAIVIKAIITILKAGLLYGMVAVVARPPFALNKMKFLAIFWFWNHSNVSFLTSAVKKYNKKVLQEAILFCLLEQE